MSITFELATLLSASLYRCTPVDRRIPRAAELGGAHHATTSPPTTPPPPHQMSIIVTTAAHGGSWSWCCGGGGVVGVVVVNAVFVGTSQALLFIIAVHYTDFFLWAR